MWSQVHDPIRYYGDSPHLFHLCSLAAMLMTYIASVLVDPVRRVRESAGERAARVGQPGLRD